MTTWVQDTKPVPLVQFLVTEALDFLMTEDGAYLITNESTTYSNDNKNNTSWVNDDK